MIVSVFRIYIYLCTYMQQLGREVYIYIVFDPYNFHYRDEVPFIYMECTCLFKYNFVYKM